MNWSTSRKLGRANQRSAPATHTIVVNFRSAGVYPYGLDYAKGGDNKLTLTMLANGAPITMRAAWCCRICR